MFRHLFERLPDIEAVGEPDRLLSPFINGIKHLDCRFTPVARASLGAAAPSALHALFLYSRKASRAPGPHQPGPTVHGDGDGHHFRDLLLVAPRRAGLRPWAAMQPSHSRVIAMASAMRSLVLTSSAPSLMAARCRSA